MPKGKVDPVFLHDVWAELLEGWILGQIFYHRRNAQRMEFVQQRSDLLVRLCVAIAAASCVLHFFVANHEVSKVVHARRGRLPGRGSRIPCHRHPGRIPPAGKPLKR